MKYVKKYNEDIDWEFDDEETEFNQPLKIGDKIDYLGPLSYYIGYQYHTLYKSKRIFLSNKLVIDIKKYKDQWFFKLDGYPVNWFLYNNKYIIKK